MKGLGRHDYIFKNIENHPLTPKQVVVNVFDLGYLGVEKDFSDQMSSLPHKKKRNQELSAEKKECNKSHSKKENSNIEYIYHIAGYK